MSGKASDALIVHAVRHFLRAIGGDLSKGHRVLGQCVLKVRQEYIKALRRCRRRRLKPRFVLLRRRSDV